MGALDGLIVDFLTKQKGLTEKEARSILPLPEVQQMASNVASGGDVPPAIKNLGASDLSRIRQNTMNSGLSFRQAVSSQIFNNPVTLPQQRLGTGHPNPVLANPATQRVAAAPVQSAPMVASSPSIADWQLLPTQNIGNNTSTFVNPRTNPAVAPGVWDLQGGRGPATVRNNNPGAISNSLKYGGIPGSSRPSSEGGWYTQFATPEEGIHAAAQLLQANYSGLTVNQLVNKWAAVPGKDYAPRIATALGIGVNDVPDLNNPEVMTKLLMAQSAKESGLGRPVYSFDTYQRGVAGQVPPQLSTPTAAPPLPSGDGIDTGQLPSSTFLPGGGITAPPSLPSIPAVPSVPNITATGSSGLQSPSFMPSASGQANAIEPSAASQFFNTPILPAPNVPALGASAGRSPGGLTNPNVPVLGASSGRPPGGVNLPSLPVPVLGASAGRSPGGLTKQPSPGVTAYGASAGRPPGGLTGSSTTSHPGIGITNATGLPSQTFSGGLADSPWSYVPPQAPSVPPLLAPLLGRSPIPPPMSPVPAGALNPRPVTATARASTMRAGTPAPAYARATPNPIAATATAFNPRALTPAPAAANVSIKPFTPVALPHPGITTTNATGLMPQPLSSSGSAASQFFNTPILSPSSLGSYFAPAMASYGISPHSGNSASPAVSGGIAAAGQAAASLPSGGSGGSSDTSVYGGSQSQFRQGLADAAAISSRIHAQAQAMHSANLASVAQSNAAWQANFARQSANAARYMVRPPSVQHHISLAPPVSRARSILSMFGL